MKRQAALAAAEARMREAEEKREEKRQAASKAAEKREAASRKQAQAKKAASVISEAKPRSTISLGFFNRQSDDGSSSSTAPTGKLPPRTVSSAPRGVPTLSNWRQNRDGSITGLISGK